jgi:beta-phosphoglucomutase-like phosphatase (HAD superfamily)
MAVASNSPAAWVELVIASTDTPPVFRAIVAIEDVDRPKPAPDLYAEAVRQLGVSGVRTVAVEDSPTGIAAARAAGLAVLGVRRGYFDDDELAEAHLLVDEVDVTAIEIALAKAVEG